jgi:RNA 3'-terminal phosphate cyclase
LADLKRKIEQYATNLERAEKFGGARSTLAESLRTQATNLSEELPKRTGTILTDAEKAGSAAEQKRIQDAARALELQKKTAKGVVTEAKETAKGLAKPLTEKAQAIRDEAQKRADTILGKSTDPKRVKEIILGSDKDVWEETSMLILSNPGGKEKFAEAVGQVVADEAKSSLKGAMKNWKYIGDNLVTYQLMTPKQVAQIEAKLQEIYVSPVDLSQKITMSQRLLRNALIGYIAPRVTKPLVDVVF